jgi:hypothetical protein
MANLAKCGDCAALTLNSDDDISKHRRWHKDWDRKFENTRTAATSARDQLAGLRNDIRGYEEQLSARPVEEPEQITVEDMPDDTELGIDDDETDESTTAEEAVEQQLAHPPVYTPTPQIDTTLLYPAIDRDEPVDPYNLHAARPTT